MSDPYESWQEEKQSAWLYRVVAECERGTTREALFNELAQAADDQAEIWLAAIMQKGGQPPAAFRPDLRARVVATLTRRFKPRAMRGVLAAMKVRGMALYTLNPPHPMPLRRDDIGKRHQNGAAGNALRAGVFGVNDGLVSNAALIYAVKGMDAAEARRLADTLMQDPERALDTLAREELGLNPDELGSPWVAAISSFAAFTAGAALPLLPFLFGYDQALPLSIGLTALGLFAVGASMSLFTGRHALLSGLRMLGIGGAAGLATYFIGAWLGVSLG